MDVGESQAAPPVAPVLLENIAIRELRSLRDVDLAPCSGMNVLWGDNGQGKTSFLEAIYLLCTTRSFRTSKMSEVVAHDAAVGSCRGWLREGALRREQSVGLGVGTRRISIDGKRPPTLAAYAVRSPVVVFHPGEMVLSMGPASVRRLLLDRIALFRDPGSSEDLTRYAAASKARQKVLEVRGPGAIDLTPFERLMGEHGSRIMQARKAAAQRLELDLELRFASITLGRRSLRATYHPGGPVESEELERMLTTTRERDRHRGSAGCGPHRDDLVLALDGRPARTDASQGEHRAITLALKLAELSCIAEARRAFPMLLLDDVSSELDRGRSNQLFASLRESPGQIFLTTTRRELIETPRWAAERRDFFVDRGRISQAPSGAFNPP